MLRASGLVFFTMDKIVDRVNLIQYHNGAVKPLKRDLQTIANWAINVDSILGQMAETCPDRFIDDLINS